jgi:hypothetical protein
MNEDIHVEPPPPESTAARLRPPETVCEVCGDQRTEPGVTLCTWCAAQAAAAVAEL